MNDMTFTPGAYFPITLTRTDENSTPITVNIAKIATIEPIIEYNEDEHGIDEPAPEMVGSSIVLDCGIAFEVKQTPIEIGEVIQKELSHIMMN